MVMMSQFVSLGESAEPSGWVMRARTPGGGDARAHVVAEVAAATSSTTPGRRNVPVG